VARTWKEGCVRAQICLNGEKHVHLCRVPAAGKIVSCLLSHGLHSFTNRPMQCSFSGEEVLEHADDRTGKAVYHVRVLCQNGLDNMKKGVSNGNNMRINCGWGHDHWDVGLAVHAEHRREAVANESEHEAARAAAQFLRHRGRPVVPH
jgi:hypothetical protein